jgi:ribonucleoside-diphosphate reductase beta chain
VIQEIFSAYDEMPFDLALDDFTGFALTQFQRRSRRIEHSRGKSLEEVQQAGLDGAPDGAWNDGETDEAGGAA